MGYRFEYMREGRRLGTVIAHVTLETAKKIAPDGMNAIGADSVRIVDENTDVELWSARWMARQD
jgi:hypothetical protein